MLAERVGNNDLTVTVPRGSSVWQELEAIVLDEQLGHGWPGNDPGYKDRVTASTLDERERIVGNLLEALRRQEGDSLTVVPAGVTLDLRAQHG